jgi:ribosomal-protein-alanine N-acetyltransferase
MFPIERIETARLLLTRPIEAEFPEYARFNADPSVMATLGGVRTEAQAREIFDRMLACWTAVGFGLWTMRDKQTGAFIGRGGARVVYLEGKPETEIAYGLHAEFWGRGYAAEVAREGMRVAFEMIGVPDLVCFTLPTNQRSRRVMEKVGFRYERDGTFLNLPHVIYRMTREEYRGLLR